MIYQKRITKESEATGNLLSGYTEVTHLSINALPGTTFSIDNRNNFIIDYTGIFDLDCSTAPLPGLYLTTWIAGPVIIDVVGG